MQCQGARVGDVTDSIKKGRGDRLLLIMDGGLWLLATAIAIAIAIAATLLLLATLVLLATLLLLATLVLTGSTIGDWHGS